MVVGVALEPVLRLHRLGRVYDQIVERENLKGFIDESLDRLKITYEISENDLANLPRTGPLLVVANHPFGGIEGLILASCLLGVREDTKVMANFLLGRIPELRELLLCVDPFQTKKSAARNLKPLKDAMGWLKKGHVLAAFPGGGSSLDIRARGIVDPAVASQYRADGPGRPGPRCAGLFRRREQHGLPACRHDSPEAPDGASPSRAAQQGG